MRSGTTVAAAALSLAGSLAAYGEESIGVKIATAVPIRKTITLGSHVSDRPLHIAMKPARKISAFVSFVTNHPGPEIIA